MSNAKRSLLLETAPLGRTLDQPRPEGETQQYQRQQQPPAYQIIAEARASLRKPSRPFTPKDRSRAFPPTRIGYAVPDRPASSCSFTALSLLDLVGNSQGVAQIPSAPRRLVPLAEERSMRSRCTHGLSSLGESAEEDLGKSQTNITASQANNYERRASGDVHHQWDPSPDDLAKPQQTIDTLLDKLKVHAANDGSTIASNSVQETLFDIMEAVDTAAFEYRDPLCSGNGNGKRVNSILRRIVPFLDDTSKDCGATIGAAAITLKVTSDAKLIAIVCKLLCKLSKVEANDGHFKLFALTSSLPALFDFTLDHINKPDSVQLRLETSLHLAATLKNIAYGKSNQEDLANAGCVHVLSRCIGEILKVRETAFCAEFASRIGCLLVQVTAALRNLVHHSIHNPAYHQALADSNLVQHVALLVTIGLDALNEVRHDITLNAVRILSKLSAEEEFQEELKRHCHLAESLLDVLLANPTDISLAVRVLFLMGNLTHTYPAESDAADVHARVDRYLEDLAQLFGSYVRAELEGDPNCSDQVNNSSHHRSGYTDPLIKLLRLLANLALDARLGSRLAANFEVLTSTVSLLKKTVPVIMAAGNNDESKQGNKPNRAAPHKQSGADFTEEFVLNVIGLLNNLSYYGFGTAERSQPSALGLGKETVACALEKALQSAPICHYGRGGAAADRSATGIAPLLYHANPEVAAESLSVLSNAARDSQMHADILRLNADKVASELISDGDRVVQIAACGLLMNLAQPDAPSGRSLVSEASALSEQFLPGMARVATMTRLSDVLADAVEEGDQELASSTLKVAHNLVCRFTDNSACLEPQLAASVKYLQDIAQMIIDLPPPASGDEFSTEIVSVACSFISSVSCIAARAAAPTAVTRVDVAAGGGDKWR